MMVACECFFALLIPAFDAMNNKTKNKKELLDSISHSPVEGAVMVVNDSVIETYYTLKVLEKAGVSGNVLSCKAAWEGLEFLQKQYVKGRALPKVIILDMRMPELNGVDFLEAFQHMPVLIRDYCKIVVTNGSENQNHHDTVMKFPQVVYYLTGTLSFEMIDKLVPSLINM
jgi:CheY-like chemotaxis protein